MSSILLNRIRIKGYQNIEKIRRELRRSRAATEIYERPWYASLEESKSAKEKGVPSAKKCDVVSPMEVLHILKGKAEFLTPTEEKSEEKERVNKNGL